jgi:hypothetical protein
MLPQTPTPQNCMISARRALTACQAQNPQTFTIFAGPHPTPRPAMPARYPLHWAMPLRPAQACMISAFSGHAPKVCQASNPQIFTISTRPCPQACTSLHNLHWAALLMPAKASMISTWTVPLKPAKPANHRHKGSPLWQPVPFRHARLTLQRPARLTLQRLARLTLQRPASSPQLKASTHRPVGPHPPATHHKRAPNMPKRHTQTGLDAKGVISEKLRLQFYSSKTGNFFSFLFPFFKGFAAWFAV